MAPSMRIIAISALLVHLGGALKFDGAGESAASSEMNVGRHVRSHAASGITCKDLTMPQDQTRSLALCGSILTHEKGLRGVMDRLLDRLEGPVNVMDAGAWMGDTALHLAQHPKVNRVYAVDPSEKNCDFLAQTAELNSIGNIKIMNMALGNKDGNYTADLPMRHRLVAGNSAWSPVADREVGSYGIAEGATLDSLYEQGKLPTVSLIHMDIKGMENEAIEGAQHLLKSRRPIVVAQVQLPESAARFKKMELQLQKADYVAYSVEESCMGPRSMISSVVRKCRNIIHIPKEHAVLRKQVMNTNAAHVTELRPISASAVQAVDLGP